MDQQEPFLLLNLGTPKELVTTLNKIIFSLGYYFIKNKVMKL